MLPLDPSLHFSIGRPELFPRGNRSVGLFEPLRICCECNGGYYVNRPQVLIVSYFGISLVIGLAPTPLFPHPKVIEGRTRMTEFHEDRGDGGGVKRGDILPRFVELRAPNAYSRELSIRSESPAVANPGSITTKCDVFPDGDTTNCK
jgi:hypothetical protein